MKYRYTKYTGEDLDDVDLEDLLSRLSDLLLSSGFDNPYGMPYEDEPGAYWALVHDGEPELRRTAYDVEAAAERLRGSGWPELDSWIAERLLTVPTAREHAELLESNR